MIPVPNALREADKFDTIGRCVSVLSDEEKWFKLDHEEVYLLKQESLKKSFNKIVAKLQQERHYNDKRKCPFDDIETELDKKQKKETEDLKDSFSGLR